MSKTVNERMTDYALNLSYDGIPVEVLNSIKLRFLDTLGNALVSSKMEFTGKLMELLEDLGGREQCGIIGLAGRYSAPLAAMVNATMAHGVEFDDTHRGAVIHPSCFVIPAALAVGEMVSAGGKNLLTAAAAGYETSIRVGMAASQAGFHKRGFHPTALAGVFGSAIIACKLMKLGKAETMNALGISGSFASGILESLIDGSWIKRLHPGWAAKAGITAAMLAAKGFSGPAKVMEGECGFYNTFLGKGNYDLSVFEDLGLKWEIPNVSFKPYPCCHYNHSFMDLALKIKQEKKIKPDDIEEIVCLISETQAKIVCKPLEQKKAPQSSYESKYSLPFSVALALTRDRAGVDEFDSELTCKDKKILALAEKVRYTVDPHSEYPAFFSGWILIKMKNGKVYEEKQRINRGSPENPLSRSELVEKFRANALTVLSEERVSRLYDIVQKIEDLPEITAIVDSCLPDIKR